MRKSPVLLILALACTAVSHGQANLVRNPSFEDGVDAPEHWVASSEAGTWEPTGRTGRRSVSVRDRGDGESSSWGQGHIPVQPFSTYRFSFSAKTAAGSSGGCLISGPDFCNRDVNVGQEWQKRSHVFVTKRGQTEIFVRVGHWNKTGQVYFDDVAVHPVVPVHRALDGLTLGAGETIRDGKYQFEAPRGAEGANFARPLEQFTAGFNSMRWVFGPGTQLVYRHQIGDTPLTQTAAVIKVRIGYYASGDCIVEASERLIAD